MTLRELAGLLGGELHGPGDIEISGPAQPDWAGPGEVVFAETEAVLSAAESSRAAALILPKHLSSAVKPYIHVDDARRAFGAVLAQFVRPLPLAEGVHPTALVHPEARVAGSARVGPYCVVERGARIENGARVFPFCYVGEDCVVSEGTTLYPHVVLYQSVKVGAGTIVHAGSVLGADGFGYAWDGARRVKVPQVGRVRLEEEVEVGALTAIDRATMGETRVGAGTKLDNLVQIAHNARLGEHCAIAAQSGVSGSAQIGDRVVMGGQSGVGNGVRIASDVAFGARTAAVQDLDTPGEYLGHPAHPMSEAKRAMMRLWKLPELFARVRRLERRVGE